MSLSICSCILSFVLSISFSSIRDQSGCAMVCDAVIFILSMKNDPDKLEASVFHKRPPHFDGLNKSESIAESGISGQDAVTC